MTGYIDTSPDAVEKLAAQFDREASRAMSSLHCGSENWEYRVAHEAANRGKLIAATLRKLAADRDKTPALLPALLVVRKAAASMDKNLDVCDAALTAILRCYRSDAQDADVVKCVLAMLDAMIKEASHE